MRPPHPVLLPLLGLVLAGMEGAATAPGPRVEVEVRARSIAPGEPVRFEVVASEPLLALEAEFLGQAVFLVRSGCTGGIESWSGWSMVPLDQAPGNAAVELHGQSVGGQAVAATRTVAIEPRTFPHEELEVAPAYVEPPPDVRLRLEREQRKLSAIYERRREIPPATEPFLPPVGGKPTSVFGTRRTFNGQSRSPHPGLDLAAATGTSVHCSGAGLVALAESLYYSGNTVIVDHGAGLFTIYAHLDSLLVHEGQAVEPGDRLGLSGATGRVTGPHLHWGAKIGDRPFDPTALLDASVFGPRRLGP